MNKYDVEGWFKIMTVKEEMDKNLPDPIVKAMKQTPEPFHPGLVVGHDGDVYFIMDDKKVMVFGQPEWDDLWFDWNEETQQADVGGDFLPILKEVLYGNNSRT